MCYYTSEMACPHFRPTEPSRHDLAPQHAMLPLGGLWAGMCHASPDSPCEPDAAALLPLCNLGYARGACPLFVGADGPDAVRFTISQESGSVVRLYYVLERDHHPFQHGPLEFDTAREAFTDPPADEGLRVQARAYLSSYLRRKAEAFVR